MGDGLIDESTTVFDYGCGRGGDVERLRELGIEAGGYDPAFFPSADLRPADIVNLGYVVNVIENEKERADVLRRAWKLTRQLIVVSARLRGEERRVACAEGHSDGVLTGIGTFQKFYTQSELREWIEAIVGVRAIAAEPGVFYLFRDRVRAEAFLLSRARSSRARIRASDIAFDSHQELLTALMEFVEDFGRLPRSGELPEESDIRRVIGTPRQAFRIIKTATGEERWDRARLTRYDELLVYLALSRFRRRPRFSDLPTTLQYDVKDFFGSYKAACEAADRALFALGEQERIRDAIAACRVGKRMPSAFYVHRSALQNLPVAVRVLEGCARELLGVLDYDLLKVDLARPRLALLGYPDFDTDPHPALTYAHVVEFDSLRTSYQDYSQRVNPPILHRKELFVGPDYPGRRKFERLTSQEIRAGAYTRPSAIGTRSGWERVLDALGIEVRGHRLVKR